MAKPKHNQELMTEVWNKIVEQLKQGIDLGDIDHPNAIQQKPKKQTVRRVSKKQLAAIRRTYNG